MSWKRKLERNWGRLGMKYKLSDICSFRKGKVEVENLNTKNYISTENMLPNKCGIIKASSLPSVALTQEYKNGDILVSNIRPYFKKIWKAKYDGGCSNDVLVFVAKTNTDRNFLYYVLADDNFFTYSMTTSKGTKMPRGDKTSIMQYEVPMIDLQTQKKIASILKSFDEKIELNNAINNNLEQQIQLLCRSWLVDYAPFGYEQPATWSVVPMSLIADFVSGYSYKGAELADSDIAMATIKNFDRKGGFKLGGYKEIQPSAKLKPEQHAQLFDTLVAHTDLTQNAEVIGNAEPILSMSGYNDIVFSMDVVKVLPKEGVSRFLIAALLQDGRFKAHALGYVNGTTVLHLSKKALPEFELLLPPDLEELAPLANAVEAMYRKIADNIDESTHLANLRNTLLPRLMSGELDVSNIDL